MQPTQYIQESLKTEARDFSPVAQRLQEQGTAALLFQLFANISELSQALDIIKKDIFYGKKIEELADLKTVALINATDSGILNELQVGQSTITGNVNNIRLLHSILGLSSEVGELITCFMEAMVDGKEIDYVNLKEEFGDLSWYSAIGLDSVGSNFEEVWEMNVNKLAKRYAGQKFTEEQANNRNLEVERSTLEGNV